uniref:Uncharacterized protein n=1 Tax=Trypanosoma vivax (strain Y486) TaxID=1055687 RepID=G0TT14_TRYVY|nr:hypothetical protein TVY486_0302820 [Trypanosoma vivax Y486]
MNHLVAQILFSPLFATFLPTVFFKTLFIFTQYPRRHHTTSSLGFYIFLHWCTWTGFSRERYASTFLFTIICFYFYNPAVRRYKIPNILILKLIRLFVISTFS